MSEEKVPRFLQQTTSHLLHQQEALRKRREMLERQSAKPPAMRFGTGSPPRSHSRHGKSPGPPLSALSSHAQEPRHTVNITPPRGDNVHRALNWSRADEESLGERAPMRFSMAFRPAPTPLANGRTRAAGTLHVPTPHSPSPRDVNTADQGTVAMRKAAREVSTPRTRSPRSPPVQRLRKDEWSMICENDCDVPQKARVSVQTLMPAAKSHSMTTEQTKARTPDAVEEETREMTRAEKQRLLPPPPPISFTGRTAAERREEKGERTCDADVMGIAGFSNTFAIPRFTTSASRTTARVDASAKFPSSQAGVAEGEGTPGRPAVGEFRTPLPVTRMSTSLTPTVYGSSNTHTHSSSLVAEDEGGAKTAKHSADAEEETSVHANVNTHRTASPEPAPWQLLSSSEASAEKRVGAVQSPVVSRGNAEEDAKAESKSPSHALSTLSVSRSTGLRTPSPTRRTKVSPAPTAQDLIQSVQVSSAERRPCGCERTTPSPEHRYRRQPQQHDQQRTTTASPAPTPVPLSDIPMTDFHAPAHKCCDRPTPASLSSQPAGGEVRMTTTPSASPWPTTENIISSILAGSQDEKRRGARRATDIEKIGVGTACLSTEDGSGADEEEGVRSGQRRSRASTMATHTPSPIPTERQYGQSVLASAEKRRCGRPTPGDREVSPPQQQEGADALDSVEDANASPQPLAHHLLDSLDVSIEKGSKRGKPAEREHEDEGEASHSDPTGKGLRTPSPTPTPEHVLASLHASAEKRARSAAVDTKNASGKGSGKGSSTDCSPGSNSFHSPTLTAQNVKDSVQKLVGDKQQHTRSDAQAPRRPWGEGSASSASETNWNSSASPVLTAEGVDVSLSALEQEHQWQSRSARAVRDWTVISVGSKGAAEDAGDAEGEHNAAVFPRAALPPSPAASDFVVQSAMFFDCVSPPITPNLPTAESMSVSAGIIAADVPTTTETGVPAEFFELQRQIVEMSEGRSRSRASIPHLPVSDMPSNNEVTSPAVEVEAVKQAKEAQRRSSLLLVQATSSYQALIQHPHQPAPVTPPPTISTVRVPRTPTPPPRQQQGLEVTRERATQTPSAGATAQQAATLEESPLPRPVTLSSQVSSQARNFSRSPVPSQQQQQQKAVHVLQQTPVASMPNDEEIQAVEKETPLQVPLTQHVAAAAAAKTAREDADLFDAKNDWMDLVEPLRPRTLTVSPQGGSVVYVTHQNHRHHDRDEGLSPRTVGREDSQNLPVASLTPVARKRSRSACTPPPPTPAQWGGLNAATAMTPASVTLTVGDGSSSCGKPSAVLLDTPSSGCVSHTPHSSRCGRRSQAEGLMAMLPADVRAEVQQMQEDEEGDEICDSPRSAGSSVSRLGDSSLHDNDVSMLAQKSTISSRASQHHHHRVDRNEEANCTDYLAGQGRMSVIRTRARAARRKENLLLMETEGVRESTSNADSTPRVPATASSPDSSASRHTRSSSKSSSSNPSVEGSPGENFASLLPSPVRATGPASLRVSTRLSPEQHAAIFRDAPADGKVKNKDRKRRASTKVAVVSVKHCSEQQTKVLPPPAASSTSAGAEKPSTGKGATRNCGRRGKKTARRFATAKAMRAVIRKPQTKRKH